MGLGKIRKIHRNFCTKVEVCKYWLGYSFHGMLKKVVEIFVLKSEFIKMQEKKVWNLAKITR